jgi:hypothetical protein
MTFIADTLIENITIGLTLTMFLKILSMVKINDKLSMTLYLAANSSIFAGTYPSFM